MFLRSWCILVLFVGFEWDLLFLKIVEVREISDFSNILNYTPFQTLDFLRNYVSWSFGLFSYTFCTPCKSWYFWVFFFIPFVRSYSDSLSFLTQISLSTRGLNHRDYSMAQMPCYKWWGLKLAFFILCFFDRLTVAVLIRLLPAFRLLLLFVSNSFIPFFNIFCVCSFLYPLLRSFAPYWSTTAPLTSAPSSSLVLRKWEAFSPCHWIRYWFCCFHPWLLSARLLS